MPTLEWIGKDKVINHHQQVPYRVLERRWSFDADGRHDAGSGSENMIIRGDNLVALKSLLPRYEGRVKCVYIDPPYNTGNEGWVYNDNVNDPRIKKWLGEVVGKEGEDLTRHDKWLCMMYPRLRLLHKLLADDGVIFVSIDDNEQANLRILCDEIFGKSNFISQILVKRQGGRQDSKHFAIVHEYCICYAKNSLSFVAGMDIKLDGKYPKYDEERKRYYKTQLLRKWGSNSLRENRPNLYYPIMAPDGTEVYPTIYKQGDTSDLQLKIEGRWRWSASNLEKAMQEGRIEFLKDVNGNWIPYEKIFAPDIGENETKKYTTWQEETGNGTIQLKQIFGVSVFDYPKSVNLLEIILRMANADKNALILDAFAGSGTTAHAVLNMNKADGGRRRFILIEMMDYAESITAERVKRVIRGYGEGKNAVEGTGGDFGFYELGAPLFDGDALNEAVGVETIREYIWYMETKTPYAPAAGGSSYFLGRHNDTDYYFYYEPGQVTVLDFDFLRSVGAKPGAVVYADRCFLGADSLARLGITFKKIPRDIGRL